MGNKPGFNHNWDNRDKLGYDVSMRELGAEIAESENRPLNRKERRALQRKKKK